MKPTKESNKAGYWALTLTLMLGIIIFPLVRKLFNISQIIINKLLGG